MVITLRREVFVSVLGCFFRSVLIFGIRLCQGENFCGRSFCICDTLSVEVVDVSVFYFYRTTVGASLFSNDRGGGSATSQYTLSWTVR